jgi:hypothetical protein
MAVTHNLEAQRAPLGTAVFRVAPESDIGATPDLALEKRWLIGARRADAKGGRYGNFDLRPAARR